MNKRKLYRVMVVISGVVSLAAVIAVSAALVAGPMSGGPEPVEVITNTQEPENHTEQPEPQMPEDSSQAPESKEQPKEQGQSSVSGALDKFMIPTDWTGKIVRENGSFYVTAAHEAYARGESDYTGELLTVGAASSDEWPLTGAEQLARREDEVYYIKLPGAVTYGFGVDSEADRDYFRMQTDLKAALKEFFA